MGPKTVFNPDSLPALAKEFNLSVKTCKYIRAWLAEPPIPYPILRQSVGGVYPSRVMRPRGLQFASHHCDLAFLNLAEHLWDARLILDRPTRLRLHYEMDGCNECYTYIPDYFWIGQGRAEFVEARPEENLLKAIDRKNRKWQPWRYERRKDGTWRCPPGEEAAAKFGVGFRVFSTREVPDPLLTNLRFLADFIGDRTPVPEGTRDRIVNVVQESPDGIPICDLQKRLSLDAQACSDLYRLHLLGVVHIDIFRDSIPPNYKARVFASQPLADASAVQRRNPQFSAAAASAISIDVGAHLLYRNARHQVIGRNAGVLTLQGPDGSKNVPTIDLERMVDAGDIEPLDTGGRPLPRIPPGTDDTRIAVAIARYKMIEPFLAPPCPSTRRLRRKMTRTQRRYVHRFRTGGGLAGLLPAVRKGNRTPQISKRARLVMNEIIRDVFMTKAAPSAGFVHGELARRLRSMKATEELPSRTTVYHAIRKFDPYEVKKSREGPRAAYVLAAPVWNDSLWDDIAIEGEHAWAVAHIDHTQLDVTTAPTESGISLGRPWLTVMVNPKHRRILAVTLSYEAPSYRSCMNVLRECVRRHRRLPRIIVVDGGKEFASNYFDAVLAQFEITLKFRPPRQGHFGSVLERLNCTINTKLVLNLPGNTKLTKRVRILTKSYNPERLAQLTLPDLIALLRIFCYDWLNAQPNGPLQLTPDEAFEKDFRLGGDRSSRIIPYNRRFLINTLPTTEKGVATVNVREGVTIKWLPYWCDELRDARLHGTEVAVRYDPYDMSTAYAWVAGDWRLCRCLRLRKYFEGRTEGEVEAASASIRNRMKGAEGRRTVSAESLAKFFEEQGIDLKDKSYVQIRESVAAATLHTGPGDLESDPATPPPSPPKDGDTDGKNGTAEKESAPAAADTAPKQENGFGVEINE